MIKVYILHTVIIYQFVRIHFLFYSVSFEQFQRIYWIDEFVIRYWRAKEILLNYAFFNENSQRILQIVIKQLKGLEIHIIRGNKAPITLPST